MTFLNELRNLNWIGLPKSLFYEDEDDDTDVKLDAVDDFRLHQIYRIITFSYENTMKPMDRIILFGIGQWILNAKISFDDFLNDEFRSRFIYFHACQLRSKKLPFMIEDALVELDNYFQRTDIESW